MDKVALIRKIYQCKSSLVAFRTVVADLFCRRSRLDLMMFTVGRLVGKKWTGVDKDFHRVTKEDEPVIREWSTEGLLNDSLSPTVDRSFSQRLRECKAGKRGHFVANADAAQVCIPSSIQELLKVQREL